MALTLVERVMLQRIECSMSETRGCDIPDDSNLAGKGLHRKKTQTLGEGGQLVILFLDGTTEQAG